MPSELAKKLLYGSGVLGLYHRLRNADTLTVVMFHRILPPDDPRWDSCDPSYTLSVDLLASSLAFFKRHYNVVTVEQVLAARRSDTRLPPRALLVTFDDGWADNAEFALPQLQRAGLPALLFVVADAVGARQPFFQERIVAAWRRGALKASELAVLLPADAAAPDVAPGVDDRGGIDFLRAVIDAFEALEPDKRSALLAPLASVLDDGLRHMVDVDDLHLLQRGGVALGLHGKTHAPMTSVPDLAVELDGARAALARKLGQPGLALESMSFPHGAHDQVIAQRAHESGYELVFNSVPVLNPTQARPGWLLGRTGFETGTVLDSRGRFRPDWLALYLFRRAHRRLA